MSNKKYAITLDISKQDFIEKFERVGDKAYQYPDEEMNPEGFDQGEPWDIISEDNHRVVLGMIPALVFEGNETVH